VNVLGLLLALVPAVAGVLALVFRARISAWNARVNRRSFGAYGERVAQNSTPTWIAVIGVGLILVGLVSVLRAIFPG
jgi:hypothetical protein